jgi:calcium-dependent protein kinase
MTEKDINDILLQIDNDDNHKINYSEFIAATIDIRKYLTKAKIEALFKSFDVDDNDFIEPDNLKNAFTKLGKQISDQDIKIIMNAHDENKDGKISLQEFENMLLGCHPG